MNLKEQLSEIMSKFSVSYKEARFMLKAYLRKLYEAGDIDKAEWKASKKILEKELQ